MHLLLRRSQHSLHSAKVQYGQKYVIWWNEDTAYSQCESSHITVTRFSSGQMFDKKTKTNDNKVNTAVLFHASEKWEWDKKKIIYEYRRSKKRQELSKSAETTNVIHINRIYFWYVVSVELVIYLDIWNCTYEFLFFPNICPDGANDWTLL